MKKLVFLFLFLNLHIAKGNAIYPDGYHELLDSTIRSLVKQGKIEQKDVPLYIDHFFPSRPGQTLPFPPCVEVMGTNRDGLCAEWKSYDLNEDGDFVFPGLYEKGALGEIGKKIGKKIGESYLVKEAIEAIDRAVETAADRHRREGGVEGRARSDADRERKRDWEPVRRLKDL